MLAGGASAEAPSTDELRDGLRRRLPDYMVPRHLVVLDALPLTATGKVRKDVLGAQFATEARV